MNTAMTTRRVATTAKRLAGPRHRGLLWLRPSLDMPPDVLQHHDGVVDEEPYDE